MYKFRIKNWGLRKNLASAVVMNTLERLEAGIPVQGGPSPLLGLQASQIRKIACYLKRNPEILQRLYETHGAAVEMLLTSAVSSNRAVQGKQRQLRPSKLRAPTQVELPDEIFRLLRTFLVSSSERFIGGLPRPPEQDESSKLESQSARPALQSVKIPYLC